MDYIEIKPLIIETKGPLAVGTGFRKGLLQRLVYIPASALKGRVRHACELLAQQFELSVNCRAPYPEKMCSAHKQACLVCRVFGAPGRVSNLYWQDALLSEHFKDVFKDVFADSINAQTYARTQVKLSRSLGIAVPNHLFTDELTIENLHFESGIRGYLEFTPIAGESSKGGYELLLLLAGLMLVETLGSGASRGIGWCRIILPEDINVNGQQITLKEVMDNLELLPYFNQEVNYGN